MKDHESQNDLDLVGSSEESGESEEEGRVDSSIRLYEVRGARSSLRTAPE